MCNTRVLILLHQAFTTMVPTPCTFMPTAISKTTTMVSLTIPHAVHLLTTTLLSMLDTTKVKASTESVTPGALPGENLATWELHGARILATLNVTLGCHICKSMPSFIKWSVHLRTKVIENKSKTIDMISSKGQVWQLYLLTNLKMRISPKLRYKTWPLVVTWLTFIVLY